MSGPPVPPITAGALVAVALGGAIGAALRWGVGEATPAGDGFPWPTLVINLVGSFSLALLPALAWLRTRREARLAVGPGILGGFTTLSAYADQSRALVADGQVLLAAAYVSLTAVGCVVAVLAGHRLAGAWAPEEVDL